MDMRQTQLATLCYLKHQGKTLMLHRIKKKDDVHQGKWNGLGGKFKPGETPEACVVREVQEESGLHIRKPTLRGILIFPLFTPGRDWVVFLFTASEYTGKLKNSTEGKLAWVLDGDINKLPLWEGDPYFLKWLEQDRFFTGKFVYVDKKLQDHSVTFY